MIVVLKSLTLEDAMITHHLPTLDMFTNALNAERRG